MRWEHCPRCKSRRVGVRGGIGCFSFVIVLIVSFFIAAIISFLWRVITNVEPEAETLLIYTAIVALLLSFVANRLMKFLYCKDCELGWRPKR